MPQLALYYYPGCYFCQVVRRAMDKHGVEAELRDIHQETRWRADLMTARQRGTVPVLRIATHEGEVRWMGESRDIVRYLSTL